MNNKMSEHSLESGAGDDINLLELLCVIAKRKRLIIKSCSIAFVLSACISLVLPRVYTATAKVLPPQKDLGSGMATALLSQIGNLGSLASGLGMGSNTTDLYLGILNSRSVSDAVIRRMGLQKVLKKKEWVNEPAASGIKVELSPVFLL